MTEEEWTRERATVIDVPQRSEDRAGIRALGTYHCGVPEA
jgi:hypothetical protein